MLNRTLKNTTLVLGLFVLLAGCASKFNGIGTSMISCCAAPEYQTFSVEAVEMPAFLGAIVMSNFNVALAERGVQPVSENGDLHVILRYEQENLSMPNDYDEFDERIDDGLRTRFMAKVVIEMTDTDNDQVVWSGSLQRIHNVGPGDYMHTGIASIAMLEAMRELLLDYPGN